MTWTQRGSEIHCDVCGKTFRAGRSCGCKPGRKKQTAREAKSSAEIVAGMTNKAMSPPVAALLTAEGRQKRLAELAVSVRKVRADIGIDRHKEERLTIMAIDAATTGRDLEDRLKSAEEKLADVERLLHRGRGGAARLDQSPEVMA